MKSEMSTSEAVQLLNRTCSFQIGQSQPTQREMLNLIENIERQHANSDSAELHFMLGVAWEFYTAWFVRGDNRKPFLQKMLEHLDRALSIEERNSGARRNDYASRLGSELVEEAQVRDIHRGIELLRSVFESVSDYVPLLCSYPEALYKAGDYSKSAEVATDLHRRATQSKDLLSNLPTAPLQTAAKAYRAIVRQSKKDKKFLDAMFASSGLLATGFATENDLQIHKKLAELTNTNAG